MVQKSYKIITDHKMVHEHPGNFKRWTEVPRRLENMGLCLDTWSNWGIISQQRDSGAVEGAEVGQGVEGTAGQTPAHPFSSPPHANLDNTDANQVSVRLIVVLVYIVHASQVYHMASVLWC